MVLFLFLSTSELLTMLILTIDHTQKGLERVLLKVVDLDVGVDVNVDFTTKVTHTYVAFYEGA